MHRYAGADEDGRRAHVDRPLQVHVQLPVLDQQVRVVDQLLVLATAGREGGVELGLCRLGQG